MSDKLREEFKPEKAYYRDISDLEDEYCDQIGCHACDGTDQNGEPNGYGCEEREIWANKYFDDYVKEDYEIIEILETALTKAEAERERLREAIQEAIRRGKTGDMSYGIGTILTEALAGKCETCGGVGEKPEDKS